MKQFGSIAAMAIMSVLSLNGAKAQADDAYFANSTLQIGSGFSPSDPSSGKQPCVLHAPVQDRDVQVDPRSASIKMAEVSSERETYEKLGFSADMSARYGIFKANGSFSKEDESSMNSNSISWIVYAQVDFGDEQLQGTGPSGQVTLLPEAQKLLNRGRPDDMERFQRMCGTEYVSAAHKGAVLYAKYTMTNADETTRKKMKALLNASVSLPLGAGGSINAQYSQEFNELVRDKKVNVEVNLVGGKGIETISKLTKDGVNLDSIKQLMSEHLAKLTQANAAALRYTTTSFDTLGWQPTNRTRELERYSSALDTLVAEGEKLKHILNPANADDQDALSLEQIVAYKTKLSQRAKQIRDLSRAMQDCENDAKKCDARSFEDLADEDISWPTNGCGIPGCLRCNAAAQCTHCTFHPAGDKDSGLALPVGGSFESFCNNMPPGAKIRVLAGGTVHNDGFYQDPYHNPPAFTGWQQQLTVNVESAGSTVNSDLWQGNPNARDRTLNVPPLSTVVPSNGKVHVTVTDSNSMIWPNVQTTVIVRPDFELDIQATNDPTPDGWAAYSALQRRTAENAGQVDQDPHAVKKTGKTNLANGPAQSDHSARGLN